MDADKLMIEAQARIISRLNDDVRELPVLRKKAKQYDLIVNSISEYETLRDAWQNFLVLVKMTLPEDVPGLTSKKPEIEF